MEPEASRVLEETSARLLQAEEKIRHLQHDLERCTQSRAAHRSAMNRRLQSLMAQTHDRVKNNLQMLASLVDMQLMEDEKSVSIEEMHRLQTHIRTLAVVHDLLTEQITEDIETCLLPVHVLLPRIIVLIQQVAGDRKLSLQAEEACLEIRRGTSLALITSELSHNALKHGTGAVEVTFTAQPHQARLEVCDDGPGFDPAFDARRAGHTGLHLVEDLARHNLNGQVRYENREDGGGRVVVTMPLR